ncbi:choline/carnitine O-acyltransferase [Sporosarcina jiandibaonis]|uniref:choline/carnitine O-acyltransferase n=1 Tax=Sporosarcina jiandibaonis TaxID=2715535 RepID=UPI001554C9D4|nr:choline/carnitine O-acyltransferase [Sporosarcina jiandibaonis]
MPSLPIPPLTSTNSKLLEWVEPLLSETQFQNTTVVVNRFFQKDGEAEMLQEKLHEWDAKLSGSWLKPLWDDRYLKYRGSLPTGMNFNILLDNKKHENRYTRAELVGKVAHLIAEFYHTIIDGEVEPVTLSGIPLDMGQYKKFFRSVRIPRFERDEFRLADFDKRNNHVVILYKNNFYKVNVTNDEGAIYQSKEIAGAIEKVFQTEKNEGANVGIFTTATRDEAAKAYDELSASKINAENLRAIADSLIVISIDEDSNNSQEAIENLMLNGSNKYFDKTIQVVITKKGELGYSIEHTAVDGTTIFAVISHVNDGLSSEDPELIQTTEKAIVEKMEWEISTEVQKSLMKFEKDFTKTKSDFHVKSRTFSEFGSDEIKNMNISPDAFFHMALQIAQYRTFGVLRSVYEPVSVRVFHEGRTECARATSMEKWNLVNALENGEKNNEILHSLMKKAGAAHSDRIIECRKGFGVERHMFGLEQMYYLHGEALGLKELPEIFKDEGYLTMRHDFISTSGMAYDNVKYRIFGPVVEGGFGLAYILLDLSISINISCRVSEKDYARQLSNHLIDALRELRQIGNSF